MQFDISIMGLGVDGGRSESELRRRIMRERLARRS